MFSLSTIRMAKRDISIFRDTVIDKWRIYIYIYGEYTNGSSISAVILRALLSTRTIAVTPYQRAFQSHRRSRFKSRFKWCQATLYSFIPISYLWSDRGRLIRPCPRNEGNEGSPWRNRNDPFQQIHNLNPYLYFYIEIYSIELRSDNFSIQILFYKEKIISVCQFLKSTISKQINLKSFELRARIKSSKVSQFKLEKFNQSQAKSSSLTRQESFEMMKSMKSDALSIKRNANQSSSLPRDVLVARPNQTSINFSARTIAGWWSDGGRGHRESQSRQKRHKVCGFNRPSPHPQLLVDVTYTHLRFSPCFPPFFSSFSSNPARV